MTESSSPGPSPVPHDLAATSAERRAFGKGARQRVRRGTLGSWGEADRGHDPLKTILAQNQIRVPELIPLRHQRMAVSPWNYYLVDHLLAEYRMTLQEDRRSLFDRFTTVDVVRQVVGVGSVGMRSTWCCWRAGPASIHCSCRSNRPDQLYTRPIPSRAATPATASG